MKPRDLTITIDPSTAKAIWWLSTLTPEHWSAQDLQDVQAVLTAVGKAAWKQHTRKPSEAKETIAALGSMPRAGKPGRLAVVG